MRLDQLPLSLHASVDEIEEVINDLELTGRRFGKRRYILHYCVDTTEIIEYCFPLDPYSTREVDVDKVAQHQAALRELFYGRETVPVLIPYYLTELSNYFNFVRTNTNKHIEEMATVERIIEATPLESLPQGDVDLNAQLDSIEKNFHIKLAVWMGISSIGARRFQDVLSRRLIKITDLKLPFVDGFLKSYKPLLADILYREQEHEIVRNEQDLRVRQVRLNAARIDAAAIDWLLQLNAAAADSPGDERHLFLYVSSAPKTRRLFDHARVRRALPLIEGRPYALWRTRSHLHLLATVVRTPEAENHGEMIQNLRQIERIAADVRRIQKALPEQSNASCQTCFLTGGDGSAECVASRTCRDVYQLQESIKAKTQSIANLGLMARVEIYEKLIKKKPGPKEQEEFIRYLEQILSLSHVPDAAIQRITNHQNFARAQSVFANKKLEFLPAAEESAENEARMLPPSRPFLSVEFPALQPPYDSLSNTVFEYHQTYRGETGIRQNLLDSIMDQFLSADEQTAYPGGPDHELARCLIYISFGGQIGEEDALRHARQMITRYPDREVDFLRVACLASLGLDKFQDTYTLASRGAELRRGDWLFYHVRAVNTFAWIKNERARRFCPCPVKQCILDAKIAEKILKSERSPDSFSLALIYNNLAYFRGFSREEPFGSIFDVDEANTYLMSLEALLPADRWLDLPSFFHTKAHVLLQFQKSTNGDPLILAAAGDAIDRALAVEPEQKLYNMLREEVEREKKSAKAN